MRKYGLFLVLFMILMIIGNVLPANRPVLAASDYWPTTDWRTSSPEEQGIDSEKLVQMLKYIQKNDLNVHSVLIIRHGYLVMESYVAPYDRNTVHNLKSVSKSILSALVGIAIREKVLTGLDQKIADIFPEYFGAIDDPRKKEITLRHLLTMTAGFDWAENTPISDKLWNSPNWVKYGIEMPLVDEPGSKFTYSTALTHMMSAALTKNSGMSTQNFAQKYLFDPLQMKVGLWRRDPQGVCFGGSELFLTPRDMAKFGYLYLNHGIWNGNQIVPSVWIDESVKSHVKTGGWGGFADYGYWWWLQPEGYSAEGWGGQRIVIVPDQDLVVVITDADFSLSNSIYSMYIAPAVHPDKMKPNPGSNASLSALVEELGHPKPINVKPFPDIAAKTSGRTYKLEPNEMGISSIRLDFNDFKSGRCQLVVEISGKTVEIPVGLDGVYRISNTGGEVPGAFRGKWQQVKNPNVFVIEWQDVGEPLKFEGTLTFNGDHVQLDVYIHPTGQFIHAVGKLVQ